MNLTTGVSSDSKPMVWLPSLAWFFIGAITYFAFGLFAVILNPFGAGGPEELPEGYQTLVLSVQFPMMWGWVPAVYRRLRGRDNPWQGVHWILLAAILIPIVFIAILLVRALMLR